MISPLSQSFNTAAGQHEVNMTWLYIWVLTAEAVDKARRVERERKRYIARRAQGLHATPPRL